MVIGAWTILNSLFIALLLVYLILANQFNSYIQPLIIIS